MDFMTRHDIVAGRVNQAGVLLVLVGRSTLFSYGVANSSPASATQSGLLLLQ
jgi:hypothetical protein